MGILAVILLSVLGLLVLSSVWGVVELVFALCVWAAAGYLAGQITRGRGYGIIGNILMGLIGGIVGSFILWVVGLSGLVHLPVIGAIITGVVGAVVVVIVVNMVSKR